jgi:dihydrofolate synthase/folylpolyglutamate synthase
VSLVQFLSGKGEAYSNINIERFPAFWCENQQKFNLPKIVHIIGTNGKGSTGRILACFCNDRGLKTVHYSSPHIMKVNERFWLNGADANDEELEQAHQSLQHKIDSKWIKQLSYFEYTTLLAIELSNNADIAILEAGLGGEYDATNAFSCDLLLITPIDYDHQHILGDTIEAIASTKINAVKSPAIIARQKHNEVYKIAEKITAQKGQKLMLAKDLAPSCDHFAAMHDPMFMAINRQLAFAAANFLGLNPAVSQFKINPLFGRLTKIAPNVYIDVGHNISAAHALLEAFANKRIILIYNSYSDKAYAAILHVLKPIVKKVLIIDVDHQRAVNRDDLIKALEKEHIEWSYFDGATTADETYLVFGSFSVAERFLKVFHAR